MPHSLIGLCSLLRSKKIRKHPHLLLRLVDLSVSQQNDLSQTLEQPNEHYLHMLSIKNGNVRILIQSTEAAVQYLLNIEFPAPYRN